MSDGRVCICLVEGHGRRQLHEMEMRGQSPSTALTVVYCPLGSTGYDLVHVVSKSGLVAFISSLRPTTCARGIGVASGPQATRD